MNPKQKGEPFPEVTPPEKKKRVLELYYDLSRKRNYSDIANETGLNGSTVSNIIKDEIKNIKDRQVKLVRTSGFFDYSELRKQALVNLIQRIYDDDWNATKALINGELKLLESKAKEKQEDGKNKEKEQAKKVADAFG